MIYPKEFYGIENRKKIAEDMGLNEQEVLDLTKKELHSLWVGYQKGKMKAANDIKSEFFCVPIDLFNARKDDFSAIMKEELDKVEQSKESEQ